jgi:hypothetical protein
MLASYIYPSVTPIHLVFRIRTEIPKYVNAANEYYLCERTGFIHLPW